MTIESEEFTVLLNEFGAGIHDSRRPLIDHINEKIKQARADQAERCAKDEKLAEYVMKCRRAELDRDDLEAAPTITAGKSEPDEFEQWCIKKIRELVKENPYSAPEIIVEKIMTVPVEERWRG